MTPDINFESLSYNPFSIHESSIDSEHDPDINFYQDISSLETHYCSPNDVKNNFQSFLKDYFSVLHLNIRSMNKNFELLLAYLYYCLNSAPDKTIIFL